jgi:serine/threonine protein kinase
MGAVWEARHLALDVRCAVKLILDDAKHPEYRIRFEREARAAAKLQSPHVVQIMDHGIWEGTPYIAMELLHGEDLAARLARVGKLSASDTVGVVAQIARALRKAHGEGIVHRDLKPENVFLSVDDDRELVKILDFGVAKSLVPGGLGDAKTRTGSLLGTPAYMSPEQAEASASLDHRTDLWSLAVIVFECVLGTNPF